MCSLDLSVSYFLFGNEQLDLFVDFERGEKQKRLDTAIAKRRAKYGINIIQSAIIYKDPKLKDLDIKGEHTIYPYIFLRTIKLPKIINFILQNYYFCVINVSEVYIYSKEYKRI